MKALLVAVVAVLSGGAVAGADGGAGAVARAAGKGATEMSVVAAGLGAGMSKVAAGTARSGCECCDMGERSPNGKNPAGAGWLESGKPAPFPRSDRRWIGPEAVSRLPGRIL